MGLVPKPSAEIKIRPFKPEKRFIIGVFPEAHAKMSAYIDLSPKEVGWLGQCTREENVIFVRDVFLFEQEVTATETEVTDDGLAKLTMEILQQRGDAEGIEIVNGLSFWGHSHVNMGTSPSGTDEKQMEIFEKSGKEWFLRGIGNKSGDLTFTLFDYKNGYLYDNVPWTITTRSIDRDAIKKELEEKVSEKKWKGANYHGYGYNYMNEDYDYTVWSRGSRTKGKKYDVDISDLQELMLYMPDETIEAVASKTVWYEKRELVVKYIEEYMKLGTKLTIEYKLISDIIDLCDAYMKKALVGGSTK